MSAEDLCKVCRDPRNGKGGHGMCGRCYSTWYRDGTPSAERKKRDPGTWVPVQVNLDKDVAQALRSAAKKTGQPLGRWLEDAIRAKLSSDGRKK